VAVVTDQPVFNNPEGFESSPGTNDWAVDAGTWEIGKPTSGPSQGHLSTNCAATVLAGNYATNVDSRLISPPFLVPSNSPALRFYHWYNFKSALGFVEISTDGGSTWNQISQTYQNGNSGNVWNKVSVDLSAYAGQTVQAAFRFASIGIGTAAGWYVDDISLVASPILNVPPTQTIYAGQTPDFPLSASLFPTNDTPRFALVSATNVVLDTNTGVLTWTNAAPLVPSTNKITVKVTDTNLQLSATASFIIQVLPPLVVTVPPTQTNYVGQKLDVTISATNNASPDDYFTFVTNSPTPTNVLIDLNTGELTWIPVAAQKGSNTITITVTNNIEPFFRVTTNFLVVVSTNIPPPTLTVPLTTVTNYPGQTLIVTNTATSVFPNSIFTFATNSPPTPTGVMILVPTNGVLTWAIPTTQLAASYRISVTVTDSVSLLIATKTFVVVISTNIPQPMLIVPPTQTNYAGQTMIVTNYAHYPNSVLPSSAFTFVLLSGPANAVLNPTNGILTWAIPIAQLAGTTNISIMVTDCVSHLIATSNFLVQVLPPKPPTLIVPPMQLIYAGQTMDVTISATNTAYTNCTFTYFVFATNGPPYLDESDLPTDGVLKWTPTAAQAPNIYTIIVWVMDNNSLSASSNFLVLVSMPPSPVLKVPPTQTNYAGQTLAVNISATNIVLTNSMFTFSLPSPSTNVSIITSNGVGVLTWTNTGIHNGILTWTNNSVSPGTNTIYVKVTDDSSPTMSATNHFDLIFLSPLPPILTVPTNQTIYVGRTLTVTNSATNTFLPNAIYTFQLPSPSTNVSITTNGVLAWTNTAVPPGTNLVSVKVTDNSVTPLSATNSFKVLVTPLPPVLTNLLIGVHGFQFSFYTWSNTTWRIDAATNLNAATNWLPILTNTAGTSGTLQFTDLLATNYLRRFYRAVLQ
jgi:hypothetical protein